MKKKTRGMRLPGNGMSWKEFFQALKKEWNSDTMGDVAGNLTFNGVLALFPFLLFMVALTGAILSPDAIRQLVDSVSRFAPHAVTQLVEDRLRSLQQSNHVGVMTVSALTAFWSASSATMALMRALNTTYAVKESRPGWKVRGIGVLITLLAAVVGLLAAVAAVALPGLARHLGPIGTVLVWIRLPIAGVLMMLLWAVFYYALPDVEQDFRFITPGSVIGVAIWLLVSWGFSIYVQHFGSYDATYGALSAVVVMLMWMWISAQVLLLGAEINAIIEHKSPAGKKVGARSMAETGADDSKTEKIDEEVGSWSWLRRRAAQRHGDLAIPQKRPLNSTEKTASKIWAAFAAAQFLLFGRKRREA